LEQFNSWDVSAIDVSEEALKIAEENAKDIGVDIKLSQADFLNKDSWDFGDIDVLVSNPPYIPFEEAEKMGESVLKHEPHVALFVEDSQVFYQAICDFSVKHLAENGTVYVELNEFQSQETKTLFLSYFEEVELKKDMQGKQRMLRAKRLLSSRP